MQEVAEQFTGRGWLPKTLRLCVSLCLLNVTALLYSTRNLRMACRPNISRRKAHALLKTVKLTIFMMRVFFFPGVRLFVQLKITRERRCINDSQSVHVINSFQREENFSCTNALFYCRTLKTCNVLACKSHGQNFWHNATDVNTVCTVHRLWRLATSGLLPSAWYRG